MQIVKPANIVQLRAVFGCNDPDDDDEMAPIGPIPKGMQARIGELADLLPDTAKITLGRDWEGCPFGYVEGDDRFDVLAFTDNGGVGHGGVNLPVYFPTVHDFLVDEDRREARRSAHRA